MISIRIEQVCLIINRKDDGVEIVFPSTKHKLGTMGGKRFEGLIELVVSENETVVDRELTGLPDRRWIPNLDDVTDELVAPKSRKELLRLDGVQAILALTGGHLLTGAPTMTPDDRDYSKSYWQHANWTGRLTNWVTWQCEFQTGRTYTLKKDGATFLTLKDGDHLDLKNEDEGSSPEDHPSGPTVFADDFNLVFTFVNRKGSDVVRPRTGRVKPAEVTTAGIKLPLCPIGQV